MFVQEWQYPASWHESCFIGYKVEGADLSGPDLTDKLGGRYVGRGECGRRLVKGDRRANALDGPILAQ